jgi:hypothetical protein
MKIRIVVAELFHTDERRDERTERHEEASSHFSQFCHRAYKERLMRERVRQPVCG